MIYHSLKCDLWMKQFNLVYIPNTVTLMQVAAKALETGVFGAYFNVIINLKDITDESFKQQVRSECCNSYAYLQLRGVLLCVILLGDQINITEGSITCTKRIPSAII